MTNYSLLEEITNMKFCDALNKLPGKEENGLFEKNFLRTWDMSDDDIKAVARGACALKSLRVLVSKSFACPSP